MDAVVIAGGIPGPEDALYPYTLGKPKALMDIGGKPMIQWVLDALEAARLVDNLVVIGLDDASGVSCNRPLTFIPNRLTMIENILGGINKVVEVNPSATRILLVSSDIPAITSEMVDWEIETALPMDVDLCYNVVKRQVIESRFPGSKRTFTRLKGMDVCGGDMNVIRTSVARMPTDIWTRLINSRKNPIKQAAIIGFDTLFLILLRAITLEEAVSKVAGRLHMTGRAIICPYA
ncbi:MAG: nucleotidyltransferase family protein, partial [Acidobacteriaceae bacterium]